MKPKLRFPGFSGDWVEKRLGEVTLKIGSGSTPYGGEKAYESRGICFIRSQNVNNDSLDMSNLVYISQEVHEKMKGSQVKANDVLLNITGASIGRSCVVPRGFEDGNVNQHVCIIRPLESFNSSFLQLILASSKGQKLVFQGQTGSGREGLNFQSISLFRIALPTIQEQQKIADFLTEVDNKIQSLIQKKEALTQYKKGLLQKLFPKAGETVPELRFPGFSGEWVEKRLGEICKITTGKLDANAMVEGGQYRFYTCAKEYYKIDDYAFDTDALLISGNGANVGYIHHYKGRFNAYQRTYVLDNFDEYKIYIKYFLDLNLKKRIDIEKKEGNTPYIVLGTLFEMCIFIPSLPEQQKIADFLTEIDNEITQVDQQIKKMTQFKKGLLQQMFV